MIWIRNACCAAERRYREALCMRGFPASARTEIERNLVCMSSDPYAALQT
jgi:hypothetical protein